MNQKVKVAMLGMGGMGCCHADQLLKMDDVEIVALCSTSDNAQKYDESRNVNIPVYHDFDRMLEETAIDALYVNIPPYAHCGQIEKAAAKKIAVFTEKPLALTVERSESIARAIEESGVKSMMGYHMRFGGAVEHVKKLMDAGLTGRPTLYSASYECNSLHTPWWIRREKCGGQIFEQIIHLYDMAYYLMGEVDCVSGFVANLCHADVENYTVEDTSSVTLRFRSGALGSITGSNCAIPDRWVGGFKVVFQNCVAEFADYDNVKLTWTNGEVREENLHFDTDVRWAENRYFIDMLKGDEPEFAPICEGLTGVRIVDGAVRSSEADGMPVCL